MLLALLQVCGCSTVALTVSPSPSAISSSASYSFFISRLVDPVTGQPNLSPASLPPAAQIIIRFPSGYTLPASLACASIAGSCSATVSAPNVTVLQYFASGTSNSISFVLSAITNPSTSGTTGLFHYWINDGAGNTVDTGANTDSTSQSPLPAATIGAGTFTAVTITPAPTTTLTQSTWTVSVTPANPIPANGRIVLRVPGKWSQDLAETAVISSLGGLTLTPSPAMGGSTSVAATQQPFSPFTYTVTVSGLAALSSQFSFGLGSLLSAVVENDPETVQV